MSTRGCIGFIINNRHKVTYNHHDSYPSRLGQKILDFIHQHSLEEIHKIAKRIQMIREYDDKGNDITLTSDQAKACEKYTNTSVGVSWKKLTWHQALNGAQGNLEAYGKVGYMPNNKGFLHHSLHCEYAYLINLDEETLEVYEGFQKSPPEGRYKDIPMNKDNGYYAVSLVNEFKLSDCPKDSKILIPGE